jgi:hypothetical protein
MNELSIDHEAYERFLESENNVLRKEGAEELRIEILRALDAQITKVSTEDTKLGLRLAMVVAEQASI